MCTCDFGIIFDPENDTYTFCTCDAGRDTEEYSDQTGLSAEEMYNIINTDPQKD